MAQKSNSVVFIHGLWLHASSWTPWEDFFGKAGYDTMAPGWPGDQDTVELAAQFFADSIRVGSTLARGGRAGLGFGCGGFCAGPVSICFGLGCTGTFGFELGLLGL